MYDSLRNRISFDSDRSLAEAFTGKLCMVITCLFLIGTCEWLKGMIVMNNIPIKIYLKVFIIINLYPMNIVICSCNPMHGKKIKVEVIK